MGLVAVLRKLVALADALLRENRLWQPPPADVPSRSLIQLGLLGTVEFMPTTVRIPRRAFTAYRIKVPRNL